MGALSSKLRSMEGGKVAFYCAACDMPHALPIRGSSPSPPASWTWNNDVKAPVFSPSVLVKWMRRSDTARQAAEEFNRRNKRPPTPAEVPHDQQYICHSFVGCNGAKPGEIKYLNDCTHIYAGKTIPLSDFPGYWD